MKGLISGFGWLAGYHPPRFSFWQFVPKQLQHYTIFFIVCQCENAGAFFAKPEMSYAVMVAFRFIFRCAVLA
jgi:hypothetical protein